MNHIRQKIILFKLIDRIIDILLVICAIFCAIITESYYHNYSIVPINFNSYTIISILFSSLIFLISILFVEYNFLYRLSKFSKLFKNVFLICVTSILTMILVDFLYKESLFYRITVIFFSIYSYLFLIGKRIIIKLFLATIRMEGMDSKNIMIVGYDDRSEKIVDFFDNHKEYGMKVVSLIDSKHNSININAKKGSFLEISSHIKKLSIDDVFICSDLSSFNDFGDIFQMFQNYGINIHIITDYKINKYLAQNNIKPIFENYFGISSITFNSLKTSYFHLVVKNILERILALFILLFSSPIIFLSLIIISITSKGSPIFKQKRVGLRGRIFKQYKLRTMFINAELIKKDLLHSNELDGPIFKIKNDPRITKIGKVLRKFSIDELPQLFNVLKGEMNIIGPRPYPVYEVEKFQDKSFYRRHSMKPGITGLWQIKGRSKIKNFNDCISLDLEYIDNWSLKNDLYIAIMTIPIIIRGTGE